MVAMDLRRTRGIPTKLTRAQTATGIWRKDLCYTRTSFVAAPAGYVLYHVARAVNDAESPITARQQFREAERGGAINLLNIGAEL
jgi:hypothetical protein